MRREKAHRASDTTTRLKKTHHQPLPDFLCLRRTRDTESHSLVPYQKQQETDKFWPTQSLCTSRCVFFFFFSLMQHAASPAYRAVNEGRSARTVQRKYFEYCFLCWGQRSRQPCIRSSPLRFLFTACPVSSVLFCVLPKQSWREICLCPHRLPWKMAPQSGIVRP